MQVPVCLLLTKNNYTNWFISCMLYFHFCKLGVESSWNVMAHGDAREGKWRGNWQMQWVASTLHTTSEHGVSSITTADAHTSAVPVVHWTDAPPADLNGLVRFARKTKSGFCACAITFQMQKSSAPASFLNVYNPAICISRLFTETVVVTWSVGDPV
jgi:hypothetical protein